VKPVPLPLGSSSTRDPGVVCISLLATEISMAVPSTLYHNRQTITLPCWLISISVFPCLYPHRNYDCLPIHQHSMIHSRQTETNPPKACKKLYCLPSFHLDYIIEFMIPTFSPKRYKDTWLTEVDSGISQMDRSVTHLCFIVITSLCGNCYARLYSCFAAERLSGELYHLPIALPGLRITT